MIQWQVIDDFQLLSDQTWENTQVKAWDATNRLHAIFTCGNAFQKETFLKYHKIRNIVQQVLNHHLMLWNWYYSMNFNCIFLCLSSIEFRYSESCSSLMTAYICTNSWLIPEKQSSSQSIILMHQINEKKNCKKSIRTCRTCLLPRTKANQEMAMEQAWVFAPVFKHYCAGIIKLNNLLSMPLEALCAFVFCHTVEEFCMTA